MINFNTFLNSDLNFFNKNFSEFLFISLGVAFGEGNYDNVGLCTTVKGLDFIRLCIG